MSLRDVLRVLDVMTWFLNHDKPLFRLIDEKIKDIVKNRNMKRYSEDNENVENEVNYNDNFCFFHKFFY